jgi:hypothetical protein
MRYAHVEDGDRRHDQAREDCDHRGACDRQDVNSPSMAAPFSRAKLSPLVGR